MVDPGPKIALKYLLAVKQGMDPPHLSPPSSPGCPSSGRVEAAGRKARAVPIAVGVVVLIAGALQFTAWKARHLACCRGEPPCGRTLPADAGTAWRHGLRLGLHCSYCCAGLTAILLVIGAMDLRAMAVVTAAITPNVSRRLVNASHEPSAPSPSEQDCY
jgi:hypothetical protein